VDAELARAKEVDSLAEAPLTEPSFVLAVAAVLRHLGGLGTNASEVSTGFEGTKMPEISIEEYVSRVHEFMGCSPEVYVHAVIYIDRVIKRNPEFCVTTLNIHRLFITAVVIAIKYFDDTYYAQEYYGSVAGVNPKELGKLEVRMLKLLNWTIFVSPQAYTEYRASVLHAMDGSAEN